MNILYVKKPFYVIAFRGIQKSLALGTKKDERFLFEVKVFGFDLFFKISKELRNVSFLCLKHLREKLKI